MAPWWGFHKSDAIAPWAYVGFDTIPQAAEEFKFSYKKVSGIMIVAIIFGSFVYTANNTITAATLENWSDLIVESASTPWLLLTAAECLLGTLGKILVGVAVSSAALLYPCPDQFQEEKHWDGFLKNNGNHRCCILCKADEKVS